MKALNSPPFTCNIEHLSHDSRGITHLNGKVVFIGGALPGERVEAKYIRHKASFDEAEIIQIIEASPDRQTPPCPHFEVCGGCQLQHLSPVLQLRYKENMALSQMRQIGKVTSLPQRGDCLSPTLSPLMGPSEGYRRKARLGVRYVRKKERVLVGFREKNGRYLADLQACLILDPRVGQHLSELANLIADLSIFEEIPQIEVAGGDEAVALIFRHMKTLSPTDIELLQDFGEKMAFHIYLQPQGPDSIHKIYPLTGPDRLYYHYQPQSIRYAFHPSDFTQVNAIINEQMLTQALQLLNLQPSDRVLDLFCGLGNFTLPMARLAKTVVGIEGSQMMVERGQENAALNGLTNTQFYMANLMADLKGAPWLKPQYDKIILDPPRAGAAELIPQIAKLKAPLILYVSCHPATLARDTLSLSEAGYRLSEFGIMDMFPHTEHVESMALFVLGKV